jgi:thermitase
LLLLACLASVLSACGGGSGSAESFDLSGIERSGSAERETPQDWAARLMDEGTPGQDYDPNYITVNYIDNATLPAHLMPPAGGASVAGRLPSAVLRENKQFEAVTDSIALRYGAEIASQVYVDVLNMAAFKVPTGTDGRQLIEDIKRDYASVVESASYSQLMHKAATVQDPYYTMSSGDPPSNYWNGAHPQWGQKRIGCAVAHPGPGAGAWDYTFGDSSVRIADCDTGVNINHEALVDSVMDPPVDFPALELNVAPFNPANHNNNIADNDGHGTFIAGIIGARQDNVSMIGVAPSCRVVPIKISDGGSTPDFNMYEGCVLGASAAVGCKIVSLSWGGEFPTETLEDLVTAVNNLGALLCVAAGNEGDNGNPTQYPGWYSGSLCVGSSTRTDSRSSFSNFGSHLDIAAPGEFLGSCDAGNNSGYYLANGTSFSCPMVAAVAGLMLSVKPSLTKDELRDLLLSTGVPTTGGYNPAIPRVNAAAAVGAAAGMQIKPTLPRLIASGTVSLSPEVAGIADRIEAYFNGVKVGEDSSAPFEFQIDTTSIVFGTASVEFRGFQGSDVKSEFVTLAIDNSAASYPLLEGFETGNLSLLPYDAKFLAQTPMDNLFNLPAEGDPDIDVLRGQGPGSWRTKSPGFNSASGVYCIQDSGSHGAYEVDALISRKLQVPDAADKPSLVFYHMHNLEKGAGNEGFDRGMVLITADNGLTFTTARKKGSPVGSANAWYSGNSVPSGWWKAEIDLSEFENQQINVIFCLQTDGQVAGQETAQPAGWWLDQITVATNYNVSIPLIGGVNVMPNSVFGVVPNKPALDVQVQQPTNVNRVNYVLDVTGGADVSVSVNGNAPWEGVLDLPTAVPNQLAQLRVQYFDAANVAGPELVVPVWIFNQPGDVNADGAVNQLDLDAFPAAVGLGSGDAGYVPFFDTDLDGKVRESDASAVGYFWGS